jgi:serine/threonine protein phosphatase PrpC
VVERFAKADPAVRPQEVLSLLEAAVQSAGHAIYHKGQSEPEKRGMGTTTSALLIAGDRGFIAHVGDSRIYMIRAGQVVQLTEDHSLVNELIRRGRITREGLDTSPYKAYKNAVTRAVGVYETVQGDTIDFEILPGDQFLLCSDGLHAYLDDARIIELLAGEDITELPRKLVDHANTGGGHDNITAVVVRVEQPQAGIAEERTEELTRKVDMLKQMPLFRHLIYKEILRVVNVTQVREYAAGEEMIKEGTPGDEMFVLLRGKIRLHKNNAFITHLAPGAHMGEMALVDPRQPRSASATAEERSRVLILRRRDFYEIIRKEPQLSVKLLWSFVQVLADRLRKTTADLSGARLEAGALDMTEDVLFDE